MNEEVTEPVEPDSNITIDNLSDLVFEFDNYIKYHEMYPRERWRSAADNITIRHMASYVESDIGIIDIVVFNKIKQYAIWSEYWEPDGPQWHTGYIKFESLRSIKVELILND